MRTTSLRWMTTAAAGVVALAAFIAPANAAPGKVNTKCGTYICVHTAHQNKFVQDITVQSRDGLPGRLRAWWGDFRSPRVTAASHRWAVGREQSASQVCGAMERDGRQIEVRCVKI